VFGEPIYTLTITTIWKTLTRPIPSGFQTSVVASPSRGSVGCQRPRRIGNVRKSSSSHGPNRSGLKGPRLRFRRLSGTNRIIPLSVQFMPFNDHAAGTRTSHLTYKGYLAARAAGRLAPDLSPMRGRVPRNVLPRGGAPSLSFDPSLKVCGITVSFNRSTSIGISSAGVEAGATAEIDSVTSRGTIAIAGDIGIGGETVQHGVIAKVDANVTNEPTAGPENVTNEPTARPENAPNEPNSAGIKQSNAPNEPTARPENAPNEPNFAEIEEPIVTALNTVIWWALLCVPSTPPLTAP
jgi:hypothetical protein